VLVSASFGVAYAILTESALSFLGLGVPLPTASWGSILSDAKSQIEYAWWLILFPGLAIFTTVAAFNVIGERIRDALDPRSI
jgi:peptide/nickel transport system permease protein